jgi:flagellar biosynthesis protein FliR
VLILFGARVGGVLLVAPVFSARVVPVMVRVGLLIALTVLLQPVALAQVTNAPAITPESMLGETLVGFAIGIGAALFVGAAEAAGDLITTQIGLSGSTLLDPMSQTSVAVLGQFAQLFAITLLLTLDGHLIMLDALAASVHMLPVGAPIEVAAGAGTLVSQAATLFELGIRFAAPVVAAALIANVALAVLSRAAPQLNILAVAFPVQIGIGLFAFAASIPLIAAVLTGWPEAYRGLLTRVMGSFVGSGGP